MVFQSLIFTVLPDLSSKIPHKTYTYCSTCKVVKRVTILVGWLRKILNFF